MRYGTKPTDDPLRLTVRANFGGRDVTPRYARPLGVMSTKNNYHTRHTYTLAAHITRGNSINKSVAD